MQLEVCECEIVEIDEEEWLEENGLEFPIYYSPSDEERYYALLSEGHSVSADFIHEMGVNEEKHSTSCNRVFEKFVDLCYDKREGADLSNVELLSKDEFMRHFDRAVDDLRNQVEEESADARG